MPLVSKILFYLEAAARMELAKISRPRQILVSNGYRRISNRYRARLQYPMSTNASTMDTGMERELPTHCQDPLEGSFLSKLRQSSRCRQSQGHLQSSNFIETNPQTHPETPFFWCQRSQAEGVLNHYQNMIPKAQPPLCILWYPFTQLATRMEAGRCKCIWFQSSFA